MKRWFLLNLRKVVATSFWILSCAVLGFLGWVFLGIYGFCLGIVIALIIIAMTLSRFVIYVPLKSGLLIMDPFRRDANGESTVRPQLSGLRFKFPWEQEQTSATRDNLFSFVEIRVDCSGEYAAKDGPLIKIPGSFVIAPDPNNLVQYYLSRNIVQEKILDIVRGHNSFVVSKLGAVEAREKMESIKKKITNYFSKGENKTKTEKDGTKTVTEMERNYGIVFKEFTMANVGNSETFQKALETIAETKVLREAVDEMRKPDDGAAPDARTMTQDEAWDNVLVISDKAKKNIQKIEGDGLSAFGGLIMSAANAFRKDDSDNAKKTGPKRKARTK